MKTVPTVRLASPSDALELSNLPDELRLVTGDIAGRDRSLDRQPIGCLYLIGSQMAA